MTSQSFGRSPRLALLLVAALASAFPALARQAAAPAPQGAAPASRPTPSGYKVGIRDVLKVVVWSQQDLSGSFTVGTTGRVAFPLVGEVQAAGRSVDEIEADLRGKLADGYLTNPQVSIEVAEFNSQRVFVVGEVRVPGPVPITGALTLVEALAKAGSLTEQAGGDLVVLRPAEDRAAAGPVVASSTGATEVARMDVRALQTRGLSSNVELRDGDTIVVARAEMFYVNGQVNSPGSYAFERDMTVLQAISRAGGVNELGSNKRVKIVRIVDGQKKELKAGLGDKIQPGDTVVVGTRLL